MAKGYKSGGRKKGTPNKLTKEIRTVLKDIIYYEIEVSGFISIYIDINQECKNR